MARFFITFLLLSVFSSLKADEDHANNTLVGEGNKKDHQDVRHEEGGVKKEELHGHRNKEEKVKHEEHAEKKEGEGVKKEHHEGGKEGEGVKKEHHEGEKEGEGVKKEEHHGERKEGEGVKKEHHEGEKEGEGVKKEEHHGERKEGEGVKKEDHHRGEKGGEGLGHRPPYRGRFDYRNNRTSQWSRFTPDEQEEKVKAARINNVIINGVPEKENEDMKETVEDIGRKLGFEYPLDDVDTAYRLICTKVPRPIVIRLVDMHIKAEWIIAYRRSKLWRERLYLEEHLTKNTQKLCHAARIWAGDHGYPHIWTWHGDVFYRKRDNPLRFKILNMEHLHKLQVNERKHEITDRPPLSRY